MGVFKVNGTDITTIAEVINNTDTRGKSTAFSSGKLNVTGLADSNKTLANAPESDYPNWGLHNIVGNKLKVNGVADTVAKKGTRPNFSNLTLLYSTSENRTITYDPNKDITYFYVDSEFPQYNKTAEGKSVFVFEITSGGGGGGGGNVNFWGGATGGGGGGGGVTMAGIVDLSRAPGNSLTIQSTGTDRYFYGGSGGGGKSNGGAGTTLQMIINGTVVLTAYGGGGGKAGASSGGGTVAGGAAGTASYIEPTDYFRVFSYGLGGYGGKSTAAGDKTDSTSINIPFDGTKVSMTGQSGGSGGGTNGGGGGGASGRLIQGQSVPGSGGADRNNGGAGSSIGAGGGGGGAHFSGGGQSGGAGSAGRIAFYY